MCGRNFLASLLVCSGAILAAGCAGSSAPAGWLKIPSKVQSQAYGAWAEVQYEMESSKKKPTVSGELIAFEEESVYVLTESMLVGVPTSNISKARLTSYDSNAELLAVWALVGTLSTPSHGVGLIFSAPAWLVTAIAVPAKQSRTPIKRFPDKPWWELRGYARFPQGLPPGLDRQSLKPKPLSEGN
ncbi:MAG TPA: hypothetical protein VI546_04270 [candidate division Zixibacteria bacterium]|nr:hypothetical protein [candidate division Zixibacteria bacterium]